MSVFKEMDPEVARKAIEGYADTLSDESKEFQSLYRSKKCPRCHAELQKEFDPQHAFSTGTQVGRALLRCANCRYLEDPFSNMVLETGSASNIPGSG